MKEKKERTVKVVKSNYGTVNIFSYLVKVITNETVIVIIW